MARTRALVTGGGGGIGRAAALALATRGLIVTACDIAGDAAEAVAQEIVRNGGRAVGLGLDVTDDAALGAAVAAARPDVVVHSAALFPQRSFADGDTATLDRVMAVNFRAAHVLAKAAWPVMLDAGGGAIVLLTSGAGLLELAQEPYQADFSFYGASKAALDRWALGIAAEAARSGIHITTLTPGAVVLTPGVAAVDASRGLPAETISAEAVGEVIAAIASAEDARFAGQRLNVVKLGAEWG